MDSSRIRVTIRDRAPLHSIFASVVDSRPSNPLFDDWDILLGLRDLGGTYAGLGPARHKALLGLSGKGLEVKRLVWPIVMSLHTGRYNAQNTETPFIQSPRVLKRKEVADSPSPWLFHHLIPRHSTAPT